MKIISAVLIGMLVFLGGCINDRDMDPDEAIPGAGTEDYTAGQPGQYLKMWETFDLPYADANKSGNNDNQLCWAAAVANMLAWTGWAADENETFDIFRSRFDNRPGYLYDALQYYFNDVVAEIQADMVTVRESRPDLLLDFIVSGLYAGKGIVIKITVPQRKVGHFLTIYGYRSAMQANAYSLYYTDSDDYAYRMSELQVTWNQKARRWDIQGIYTGWYIEYVVTLSGPHQM